MIKNFIKSHKIVYKICLLVLQAYFYVKSIAYNIFWCICLLLPIKKNKIVFDNFGGKGFGDNPKYIATELLNKNEQYDLVWLVSPNNKFNQDGIRCVKWLSFRGIYELSTANIWVDNIRKSYFYRKKKGQYYIQTWHGQYGGKKCEKDVEKILSKKYVKYAKRDSKNYDIFLSNSTYFSKVIRSAFWYDGKIEESGFPRNDILLSVDNGIKKEILRKLKINDNYKIILYAPTFRDDLSLDKYNIDYNRVLKEIRKKTNYNNWIMLIRLHPNVQNLDKYFTYDSNANIKDVTNYNDMQELLAVSDLLITDYSSAYIDFMMMNKPIILYTPDFDSYMKTRSFYIDMKNIRIPRANNNDELIKIISKFSMEEYITNNEKLFRKYSDYDDGNASKRVAQIIMNYCSG